MNSKMLEERKKKYCLTDGTIGFSIDVAGMDFKDEDLNALSAKFADAHKEMIRIESGEIKNPDENRKVTHFTDRAVYPGTSLFADIQNFAEELRTGLIKGCTGKAIENAVINGIGGSALGPQLIQNAIRGPYWNELPAKKRKGFLRIYFLDNTDTAELKDLLDAVELDKTILISISKSGGTQETKNNMIAFRDIYSKNNLDFAKHSCAVTMIGSELDKYSKAENWLRVFPLADSIGGRTSETSVVGHLPAALAGIDFKSFLQGACHMDAWTREPDFRINPSYLLAAMWFIAGKGKGDKNMVIVPYSDRLILLSRYLQQLVMESLGKEKDLDGKTVHQGLNVFGNKGGTDAHAFIQQLNDGRNDFFVTFIEVLKDYMNVPIDGNISMSDYLHGFLCGLSNALLGKDREVIRMSVREMNEFNLGLLIALYERAVAYYAELVHINAFHQPGVQAYKLASKSIISLTKDIQVALRSIGQFSGTAKELLAKAGLKAQASEAEGILAKFAENSSLRKFNGFKITREWNDEKGWVYEITVL